ncbi:MAG: hypothetical protein K5859_03685 [Atopobiaceae bacterium]|nr:hypothetical protein [Atopobiaceae bacterium]
MAEYIQSPNPQIVAAGQNLLLADSIPCRNGYVVHRNGSGILTLRGITSSCFARYQVTFNGNIAIPTGGTVGAIAVALAIDGESLQYSRAIATPAAAEQYFNVTSTAIVTVPKGCCYTIAVENVDAGVDGIIAQQAISVADGNLTVSRIA